MSWIQNYFSVFWTDHRKIHLILINLYPEKALRQIHRLPNLLSMSTKAMSRLSINNTLYLLRTLNVFRATKTSQQCCEGGRHIFSPPCFRETAHPILEALSKLSCIQPNPHSLQKATHLSFLAEVEQDCFYISFLSGSPCLPTHLSIFLRDCQSPQGRPSAPALSAKPSKLSAVLLCWVLQITRSNWVVESSHCHVGPWGNHFRSEL